ncbi:MAG: hypothetical protein IKI42_10305, partial [Clostridia bacterium]|nr:hypothetical protein [Clostridia bacterium]
MLRKIMKRLLSTVLVLILVFTTFFIFDPAVLFPKAEAGLSQSEAYADLYFVVPEAIYLAPHIDSSASATSSNFQWYLNNTLSGTSVTPDSTCEASEGKIYYKFDGASTATLTYKWQSLPGTDISASTTMKIGGTSVASSSGSKSLSSSTTAVKITEGTGPSMDASVNGRYICWILSFTDSRDGASKQAYAYTYVYKPYIGAVGAGANQKCYRRGNFWQSSIGWISGFHSVYSAGNRYQKVTSDYQLVPFANSAAIGAKKGQLNPDSLYYTFAGSSDHYFDTNEGDHSSDQWTNTSQEKGLSAGFYHNSNTSDTGNGSGNDYYTIVNFSATAMLTVDVSRFTNLNQIPNLNVGMMVTDDEDSYDSGAWGICDYTGSSIGSSAYVAKGQSTVQTQTVTYLNRYTHNDGASTATHLTGYGSWNSLHGSGDGNEFKAAVRWAHAIPSSDWTAGAETYKTYYASAFNILETGTSGNNSRCTAIHELRMRTDLYDKSGLRAAQQAAMRAFPIIYKSKTGTPSRYNAFLMLYRAVCRELTRVNGTYMKTQGCDTPADLVNALNNSVATLKSNSNSILGNSGNYAIHRSTTGKKLSYDSTVWADMGRTVTAASRSFTGYTYTDYTVSEKFELSDFAKCTDSMQSGSKVSSVSYSNGVLTLVTTGDSWTKYANSGKNVFSGDYFYRPLDPYTTYVLSYDYAGTGQSQVGIIYYDSTGAY